MAFAGELGARVALESVPRSESAGDDTTLLWSESGGRLLVEVAPEDAAAFEAHLSGEAFAPIGETLEDALIEVTGLDGRVFLDEPLAPLKDAWREPLAALYETASGERS
jgi:phosphoribosylformylglycinamidine synthase